MPEVPGFAGREVMEQEYFDSQGRSVSLEMLCRLEPEWASNCITTFRAEIKAKDAEIAELEKTVSGSDACAMVAIKDRDAAEARVKEMDKLACDLANESTERGVRIAALEKELAEAKRLVYRSHVDDVGLDAIDDAREE
mgnify:CR=1 FL=1